MASMAYAEQLGWNRQDRGRKGESSFRYADMTAINNTLNKRLIGFLFN